MKNIKRLAACLGIGCAILFAAGPAAAEVEGEEWQGYVSRGRGVVLCERLSLREAPEQGAKRYVSMPYGATCQVMDEWENWYGVSYEDAKGNLFNGWVRSEYVLFDPVYYTTTDETPVYAYPDWNAKWVGLLGADESYPIIAENKDFYVISLRGASGFVEK